jgi:ketosteroid isomerase-like protein
VIPAHDDRVAIREVIQSICDAWQNGPPDAVAARIRPCVAADAVIVGPDLTRVALGGDAVAQSYADFVASATVLEAALDEPQIDVSSDVAVATMTWRMRYEYEGAQTMEAGVDTYVFARRDGRWIVTWRRLESHVLR